jgi:uncharacterized protein (DUF885 family)
MEVVRDSLGFTGSKAEFHERLRSDPRFYARSADEFGQRLMEQDARIRPHIEKAFLQQPEAPYGVARLDPALQDVLTYGYYAGPTRLRPAGTYFFNGSQLEERSLLSAAALAFHELIPGHHFQIALVRENDDLPEFRRQIRYPGYTEGWAEYSSSVVARDLGMYEDLYDLYGRLVFDMFFAVRLVVDTGMNYLGWSRERAMAFMSEYLMESDVQIASETLRYVDRPAQALAYWLGRQAFVEARETAERGLGEAFDVRRYHHFMVSSGPLPLPLLREHVQEFIRQERNSGSVEAARP